MAQVDTTAKPFYFTFNMSGIIFEETAKVYSPFGRLPGSVNIQNKGVPTINLGYYFTPSLSIDLAMGPIPPRVQVHGAKQAARVGYLGSIRVAPGVVAILYHYNHRRFHAYFGPGFNYTLFFGGEDAPGVRHLTVQSHPGYTLTFGINYDLSASTSLNLSVTQIFLRTRARAELGGLPVAIKAQANPLGISAGLVFHF